MSEGGANCRMCLVEVAGKGPDGSVRKMPKPQTACSLPVSEGMEIVTESEQLNEDRKGVLSSGRDGSKREIDLVTIIGTCGRGR